MRLKKEKNKQNPKQYEDKVNKTGQFTLSNCFPQSLDSDAEQIYSGMVNLQFL